MGSAELLFGFPPATSGALLFGDDAAATGTAIAVSGHFAMLHASAGLSVSAAPVTDGHADLTGPAGSASARGGGFALLSAEAPPVVSSRIFALNLTGVVAGHFAPLHASATLASAVVVEASGSFAPIYASIQLAPSVTLTAVGHFSSMHASVSLLLPSPGMRAALVGPATSVSGRGGGVVSLAAKSPATVYARVFTPGVAVDCPLGVVVGYSGGVANISVPSGGVTAQATVLNVGQFNAAAPSPIVTATATVGVAIGTRVPIGVGAGQVAGRFGAAPVRLSGALGMVSGGASLGRIVTANLFAPRPVVTARASFGSPSYAHLVGPSIRVVPSARAALVSPMPVVYATGGPLGSTAGHQYQAYAINAQTRLEFGGYEVTRYTNFNFFKIVQAHGRYFGVAHDGIYALEGDLDNAAPIDWVFRTTPTDFNSAEKKRVAAAYFDGRLPPESTFRVVCGEVQDEHYLYPNVRGNAGQNYRCAFGRGMSSRYYAFGLEGAGLMELSHLDFEVHKSTRRI